MNVIATLSVDNCDFKFYLLYVIQVISSPEPKAHKVSL